LIAVEDLIKISSDSKNHNIAKFGFAYYKSYFKLNGNYFSGVLNIGLSEKEKFF